MPSTFFTSLNETITLGPKLGSGGEGEVYELQGQPELVAKLYHEALEAEKAEKLQILARLGNERLFKLAAWPMEVLRAKPAGEICGFLMRKIGDAAEVHTLHSPKSRLQKFPEASWAFLIYVAANIARAVSALHEQGFVIGDVNPKNILVTRQATVCLLDCDSFQVIAEGKTYRCAGGFPEYTPPELQGVIFREVDRQPEHDWFGLAIVIFQLLFLGRHPFSGKYTGAGELTLEQAIKELRFAYGADAATRAMQPPPGTLALDAVPEPLAALFRRVFLSDSSANRPRPHEWIAPLETLAKSLKQCALHSGHRYWQTLAACPWCEIEVRARIRLFNFALNGKARQRGYFRLDEVWREIEGVRPPHVPLVASQQSLVVVPSAEADAAARRKQNSFRLAILMSLIGGFSIGMLANFPIALFLLFVAGRIVRHVASANPGATGNLQTLWQGPQTATDELALQFEQVKLQAEAQAGLLTERWQAEASDNRFRSKLKELRASKSAYEKLPQNHHQWFRQMEETARAEQLNQFLAQFELDKAVLKDFAPSFYHNLHLEGIRTAADVTPLRLRRAPLVGDALSQVLLEWRSELEQQFVFDLPKAVPSHVRVKLEKELDDTRARLEHELRSGAFYLSHLSAEIKESQQALHDPLLAAQKALAQAEKDYEAVAKRNPFAPLVAILLIAFFFGVFGNAFNEDKRRWLAENIARNNTTETAPQLTAQTGRVEQAKRLYELGQVYFSQANWVEAGKAFQSAIDLTGARDRGEQYWQAQFYVAVTVVNLGAEKSIIENLNESLKQDPDRIEDHFRLGALYLLTNQPGLAGEQALILQAKDLIAAKELQKRMRQRGVR